MHDVRADITYVSQTFPDGTPAIASYVHELRDGASVVVQTQTSGTGLAQVTFLNPAPGSGYTVRGFQRDSTGATIGTPVNSAAFVVPADVILLVVSGITVQVIQG